MENIICDENGNSIWADPEERLAYIEKAIKPKLENFKHRIEQNEKKMYPAKLNFIPAVINILDAHLRLTPLVSYDYAIQITKNQLQEFANAWFRLMIFIRDYVEDFIANKQTFCAFASISVGAFNQLGNSENGEICAIIDNLRDSFHETNMSGAMGGTVNTTATFNRMRAKDAGYNMSMTATGDEAQTNTQFFIMTNDTVKKELGNLFGGKLLDNKKK